jgi:nicotinamide riboside transporter PnuC
MEPIKAEQQTERERYEADRWLQHSPAINWPLTLVSIVVIGLLFYVAFAALVMAFG